MSPLLLLLACDAPAPSDEVIPVVPPEVCNGADDDGDGVVDEGVSLDFYEDLDWDGVGGAPTTACEWGFGLVTDGGDCDDTRASVNPLAPEVCGTPEDDDCDGTVDEDEAEGCVPAWRVDADQDGYGDGEPGCVCDPAGLISEADCDPEDADRGLDCLEGAEVPLDGARLLDDADETWTLLGTGDLDGETAGPELALLADDTLAVATIPAEGEALLTASLHGSRTLAATSDRALGDLDGDGLADVAESLYTAVSQEDDWYMVYPRLRALLGPHTGGGDPAWTHSVDGLRTTYVADSLFVADLDGDGVSEQWYGSGTTAADPGEAALWRADASGATEVARTTDPGALYRAQALGDLDGDGVSDLGVLTAGADGDTVTIHPGPVLEFLPDATATVATPQLFDLVALGDLDADGYDDAALRGQRIHVLRGPVVSGEADTVAAARVGSETDDTDESALFAAAGDVGADGTRDLVIADTYWPARYGAEALRGAVYVFHAVPSGVVDARAADTRVYGAEYGGFGAYPSVLEDGRVVVGAHLETHAAGTGVFWVLEGL